MPWAERPDRHFYLDGDDFAGWAGRRRELRMEFFYREMRRRCGLLMNGDGTPVGGAWNFDADNRKALPRHCRAPLAARFGQDAVTREVLQLVGRRFSHHYGALAAFDYPVTHAQAEQFVS